MTVTEMLRNAISQSGQTHYRIGKGTGIDPSVIDRYVYGETDPKGTTINKLCEYFGLELCRKKQRTGGKQAGKSAGTVAKKDRKR